MMKAAIFHGPGDLRVAELPRPTIREGELLVETAACAMCGSDLRTYRYGARNITPPVVLGHEISGTIVEVGHAVTGYVVGQRVAVAPAVPCGECAFCERGIETMCDRLRSIGYEFDGGFAEFLVVPATAVRAGCVNPIPENLSFIEAAVAEPLACVINAQEIVNVGSEDTVAILGAGPIGCLHANLARIRGARRIILADLRPERLRQAAEFGADVLVDASAEDVGERVSKESGGVGASVVIVAAPSHRAQEQGVAMAAKRGRINLFGGLPKSDPLIHLDANLVHYRELSVVGSYGSRPVHNRMALELLASGRIRASRLIGLVLPLDRVLDGLTAVERGVVLKVVVCPSEG
jgi:L-iditol 2-dehydrogenase